jgi:hypothetical protein
MTASSQTQAPAGISISRRSDVLVLVCITLALVAGWFFKNSVQTQTQSIEDPLTGLRLKVPITWQADQQVPNVILAASDSHSASTFKTKLNIVSRQIDTSAGLDAETIVNRVVEKQQAELIGYHLLAIENVDDRPADKARLISYAYVVQPESVDRPFQASLPVVVQAADYLIFEADRYYVLTFAADSLEYAAQAPDFDLIMKSVDLP